MQAAYIIKAELREPECADAHAQIVSYAGIEHRIEKHPVSYQNRQSKSYQDRKGNEPKGKLTIIE